MTKRRRAQTCIAKTFIAKTFLDEDYKSGVDGGAGAIVPAIVVKVVIRKIVYCFL